MICDAFIKGLESVHVRQRTLENEDITLQHTLDLALSLSQAQEHATHFNQDGKLDAIQTDTTSEDYQGDQNHFNAAVANRTNRKLCFFCGNLYLKRENCPAKDIVCFSCRKRAIFLEYAAQENLKKKCITSTPFFVMHYCWFS